MKIVTVLLVSIISCCVCAQTFQKKIDFESSTFGLKLAPTPDGGYIFAGATPFAVPGNGALVKLDASGDVQWSKLVMPPSQAEAVALYSIVTTRDGGYAATGYTNTDGVLDIWIIKFTALGEVEWNTSFGSDGNDVGYSIIQTQDGGYAVTGYAQPNGSLLPVIIKVDPNGTIQWDVAISGTAEGSFATSIIELQDSTLLITGGSGLPAAFVVSLKPNGTPLWRKVIASIVCTGWNITETPDHAVIMCGGQNQSYYLVKFTFTGFIEWTKIVNPLGFGMARSVLVQPDGTLVVAGSFSQEFNAPESDSLAIFSLTPTGTLKSFQVMTLPFKRSEGFSMNSTSDGGFILGGFTADAQTRFSLLLSRFDSLEYNCFMQNHLVSISEGGVVTDSTISVIFGPPLRTIGKPTIVPTTVTVTDLCAMSAPDDNPLRKDHSVVISPNPITASILSLHIPGEIPTGNYILFLRDALGKEVHREKKYLNGAEITIPIQVSDLPVGVYTVDLLDANTFTSIYHSKVVKIK